MPKKRLADFIKIYPNALSAERCRALIERFEASPDQTVRQIDNGYSFVQVNISQAWPDENEAMTKLLSAAFYRYQSELDVRRLWPPRYFYENIRIQRYLPNGRDAFPPHVDAYNNVAASRFMTAILYLNAPDGGETTFPDLDISVTPETGKLLIFPPLWTFPHAGAPPRMAPKYVLVTFLLYPPP